MAKTLFEILPGLEVSEQLKNTLDGVVVNHVVMPRSRDRVDIYMEAPRVISRRDINILKANIKKQFFSKKEMIVEIHESFNVALGTAQAAYNEYRDSIMLALKEHNHIEYTMLAEGQIEFPGAHRMELHTPATVVNEGYARELQEILKKIFLEKLRLDVDVRIDLYRDTHTGQARQTEDIFIDDLMKLSRPSEPQQQSAAGSSGSSAYMDADFVNASDFLPETTAAPARTPARDRGDSAARPRYRKTKRLAASEGYGRDFDGEIIPLEHITEEMGEVTIAGDIFSLEERELRTGNILFMFAVTDYTDSIKVKIFAKPEEADDLREIIGGKKPSVILRGNTMFDTFDKELSIQHVIGIKKYENKKNTRSDDAEKKRVELHCHTMMSDMDGVSDVGAIVKQAAKFGHSAIAITDHGVVQSFPKAMHTADDLAKDGKPIKIIYGCEGYLVNVPEGASLEEIHRARPYHIIIIAKNETGRVNLYRLVSESHLYYFGGHYSKAPRIPRWLLEECRDGLILGSACEQGELIQAILAGATDEELDQIASFYDYLEVQPIGNNAFMLREERLPQMQTEDDLRDLNRKVVEIADRLGKPCVATCDVHYLNPEDEIYRRIIMAGKGFKDADQQAPLYLHTTQEMLDEFAYLGRAKAEEIVVINTNLISDMCEAIRPVRPDKCPPVIEGSDTELREMCYAKAHSMYGDPLPQIVQDRLDRELNSIISNGYAVMYIIAQRLIKKSNDDGYLVGSRGSVGSSLAATMSNVTEVNPLPPHYRCPKCHYSDFDSDFVKQFVNKVGCDMPDRDCPVCGTRLIKDGFDIPFEVFLGFKGDKEPDIDLNFSGEYQAKAHAYTEVLFGKGHTFKAGTISGLAEKTAYGYVLKYFEERGITKRRCEIERLAAGCVGIRRSTGQHPGGIVVMPRGENIYSFTPIQHPANDMTTDIVTTHFDYHSIDQNLLKLDILGHDDPTMIRRLQDLTGIDPTTIPLDDPEVMQLFKDTSSLGITPADIGGAPLGTLGIPEFGTDLAMTMVIEAQPQCFADLLRISGLAHGTDVWIGNARDLILSGTATLQTAICCRDDIMLYLIQMGMDPSLAFNIMESVRKGRGLKPDWEEAMKAADVPDWYIDSCKKIKYMFPKAHASAYVMMAWRVAYCKVHRPLEYYTAYFSIRADGFDYEKMGMGRDILLKNLEYYRKNVDNLTDNEKLTLRDMRLAEEMYARGIEFTPIDLYQVEATRCKIVDGKIMPRLNSISGLGDKAAESIVAAAARGRFLSKEDFIDRTKVGSTLADTLDDLGILGNIPKTNQLSLFDIELA